jgi:hypothetical protein
LPCYVFDFEDREDMKRKIEQWRGCEPEAMAGQSKAAITYAFEDAKADIIELHNMLADGNAALIADAPAMLDALRELVDFAQLYEHHRYYERSKAAFDRAYDILERHGG